MDEKKISQGALGDAYNYRYNAVNADQVNFNDVST